MAMALVCSLVAEPAGAHDGVTMQFAEGPAQWLSLMPSGVERPLLSLLPYQSDAPRRRGKRLRINVSPFVSEVVGWFRQVGIPLREDRHPQRDETIGVSASVQLGDNLPALSFWVGERSHDALGAFYSPRADLSWAIVWPVDRFTLRVEGGDDSELGYFAVLGIQWLHPTQPIAVGIGIPMRMQHAEGDLGVVLQLRMKLE